MKSMKIAIAGNPNVGKSTLFNVLTGSDQHVGNYPGVTVERKEGYVDYSGYRINIVDLPGIYSMNAFSPEEIISRKFIAEESPDIIVNIIETSNLEKNLYLTLQILEMRVPVIIFLNMMDSTKRSGVNVSTSLLEHEVETPVVAGVAKSEDCRELLFQKCIEVFETKPELTTVPYSETVRKYISKIKGILDKDHPELAKDWIAIRLIEGSSAERKSLGSSTLDKIDGLISEISSVSGHKIHSMIMVQERYALIKNIVRKTCCRTSVTTENMSSKIDKVLLNDYLSLPLFVLTLFIMFQLVFTIGEPLEMLLSAIFEKTGMLVGSLWTVDSDSFFKDILVNGIIGGVGGILVFAPYIFLVFAAISILEDSGYMSRVAVIMDKWMGKIGLSGKSFMPMVLGFGCTVPAIMGARIIENKYERLATIMVIPFMSCGARLPVYLLIISAFIPFKFQALVLLLIYAVGVIFAAVSAKILRLTVFKGEENPLIIELPSYSRPSFRTIIKLTWERGRHFLEKAGTIILFASMILWFLNTYPKIDSADHPGVSKNRVAQIQAENSFAGRTGLFIEPVFKVFGADWKIASSFIASLAAKELFVSQMSILNAIGDGENDSEILQGKFKEDYSLPTAVAIILFILLSAPCIATFAAVRSETNSWLWPSVQYANIPMNVEYIEFCYTDKSFIFPFHIINIKGFEKINKSNLHHKNSHKSWYFKRIKK